MIDWSCYSFTEEQLRTALSQAVSKREILIMLGLQGSGANYDTITNLINSLGLDKPWEPLTRPKRIKHSSIKLSINELLVENGPKLSSKSKRKRLLEAGVLTEVCSSCGLGPQWNGKPITLHIDHIDGRNRNNVATNLRMLCPNCHSQTSTYAGRNSKKKIKLKHKIPKVKKPKKICIICKQPRRHTGICIQCSPKEHLHRIQWPSLAWLESRLQNMTYVDLARELGVSDTGLRKHIRSENKRKNRLNALSYVPPSLP